MHFYLKGAVKYHTRFRKRSLARSKAYHPKNYARSAQIALDSGWGRIGVEPYHPFIPVHRFPGSRGFVGKVVCPRTGGIVHCLSKGEINWARQLLWTPGHIRLFSQVAIPRHISYRLAKECKVLPPRYPDRTWAVMTIDFIHLLEVNGEEVYVAYSIKDRPESITDRKQELLDIEEMYCIEKGIDWHLRYKSDVDRNFLTNIKSLSGFVGTSPLIWGSDRWRKYELQMYREIRKGLELNVTCRRLERALQIPPGRAMPLVRFFLANRIWHFDWNVPLNTLQPLKIIGRNYEVEL